MLAHIRRVFLIVMVSYGLGNAVGIEGTEPGSEAEAEALALFALHTSRIIGSIPARAPNFVPDHNLSTGKLSTGLRVFSVDLGDSNAPQTENPIPGSDITPDPVKPSHQAVEKFSRPGQYRRLYIPVRGERRVPEKPTSSRQKNKRN